MNRLVLAALLAFPIMASAQNQPAGLSLANPRDKRSSRVNAQRNPHRSGPPSPRQPLLSFHQVRHRPPP